jgi:hypothetical protein
MFCRLFVPFGGLLVILLNTFAFGIRHAQLSLCFGIALFSLGCNRLYLLRRNSWPAGGTVTAAQAYDAEQPQHHANVCCQLNALEPARRKIQFSIFISLARHAEWAGFLANCRGWSSEFVTGTFQQQFCNSLSRDRDVTVVQDL